MIEKVEVTIHGRRKNGVPYQDTVTLTPYEWSHLLESIRERIDELEARPGHIAGLRSMGEYNRLVHLMCKVDI
jgi:hypothetical protein